MKYRKSNEEKQAELNARLSGRYIVRNGEYIGILKSVTVVAPPSGFNTEYSVEMYGNVFYHTTRISDFIPVTADELVNRFGDDVLKNKRVVF